MKQLLSLILSFQLISFPVVAATQQADTPTQTEEQKKELSDPNKNAQVDVGTNADYDARSQGGGGYGNFAKQILGASTAIIGSNILSSCKWGAKVPSILTFMGGAIAYLVSEVSGGKKQNEEHKQRLKRIEELKKQVAANKGGGDVQRILIEQRLEEEEKILQFVKERSQWGMAIMAIYGIATALAISEEMTGMAAGTAIGITTCQGLAAQYASPCGKAYAACYAKHIAACTPFQPAGQMAAKAAFMSPTSLETGEATCTGPYMTACQANLKAYAAIAYANCQPTASTKIMGKFTVNLYSTAFGLGMGYGSAGNLQTLLQLAGSLTTTFVDGMSAKVTALYSYPIPRSITFGAHMALMGVILAGLKGVESQTEENISALKKVVNQFRSTTDDTKGTHQGGSPSAKEGEMKPNELEINTPGSINLAQNTKSLNRKELNISRSKTCFSNSQEEMDISEKACENSVAVQPIKLNIKQHTSPNIEKGIQLVNDLNRSVTQGNMDEARTAGRSLAAMASSIRGDLDQLQNDYNKKLPKDKQVDFAKAINEKAKELEMSPEFKNIIDAFEKEQGIKLASYGPGSMATLDSKDEVPASQTITEAKADETVDLSYADALAAAALAAQNYLTEGVVSENSHNKAIDEEGLLFGGDRTSTNPFGLNEDAFRAASANGYLHLHGRNGYSVGEGVADQKENLFKIISNRYFLSYPKVMRKKVVENQSTE